MNRFVLSALLAATLAGCGDMARLPEGATVGPSPQLPAPTRSLIPTVHIAEAAGWPAGQQPTAPSGWRVTALATGLAPSALVCTCCPMATCWSPRATSRRRSPRTVRACAHGR